jgi:hypothetical protein
MDKNEPKIERKSFTGIELKKDKPGFFNAKFATLNVIDKDGDVTLSGAFPEGKEVLVSAYMHGSWSGGLPVGKGVIRVVGDDVLIDGEFYLNTAAGKEHYETIKNAPNLQEWSYGFIIKELAEDTEWNENPKVWRVIKLVDIFEVSPVLRGAGVDTRVLDIKSEKEGLSYSDEAEAVLAAVNGLVTRTKSLADLRKKENRDLSAANRERLTTFRKSLTDLSGEIQSLLAIAVEPHVEDGKAALAQSLLLITKNKQEILN